ncbi:hypothetical protein ACFDTO_06600 [Microbacteriaceae bacterium 4G12]
MIARLWTGVVARRDRDAYVAYVEATGVGEYRRTPGCTLATILTRDLDDTRTEITALSLWASTTAIQAFAGDDITEMVLYPEDERYLVEEPTLRHYDVASPPGHGSVVRNREGAVE